MFAKDNDDYVLRLVDFGFACPIKKRVNAENLDIVGTPYYIAPEVLTSKYSAQADIWSAGVVLYETASGGHMPFNGKTRSQLFKSIKSGKVKMKKHFSLELQDLLKNMLVVDPKKRFTAAQCL